MATKTSVGEKLNPLSWPFLLATASYGIGFSLFLPFNSWLGHSSVYDAMKQVSPSIPILWGIAALVTIALGILYLLNNKRILGQTSGLIGFALWCFVAMCYILGHDWMVLAGVAAPNMWFWIWQYLGLTVFSREKIRVDTAR